MSDPYPGGPTGRGRRFRRGQSPAGPSHPYGTGQRDQRGSAGEGRDRGGRRDPWTEYGGRRAGDPYGPHREPTPGGYPRPGRPRPGPDQPDRPGDPASPYGFQEADAGHRPRRKGGPGTPVDGNQALPPAGEYRTPARGYHTPMPDWQDPPDRVGRYPGPGGFSDRTRYPDQGGPAERNRYGDRGGYAGGSGHLDQDAYPDPGAYQGGRGRQPGGQGSRRDAHRGPGSGSPGSGYPGSGYPGSGYPGSGSPESGYRGPGDRYRPDGDSGARDWLSGPPRPAAHDSWNTPAPAERDRPRGRDALDPATPPPGSRWDPAAGVPRGDDQPNEFYRQPPEGHHDVPGGAGGALGPGGEFDPGFAPGFTPGLDDAVEGGLEGGSQGSGYAGSDYPGFWEDDEAFAASGGSVVGGIVGRTPQPAKGRGGRGGRPKGQPPGRKPRRGRRTAPIVALVILLVFIAGGGAAGYKLLRTYVIPPDFSGPGTGGVTVQIGQGQSAHDVAQTLARMGVVASPRAFIKAVQADSQAQLDPGTYRLHKHMKASLALQLLLSPAARVQARVTIPEGWRVSQIMAALGSKSGIPLSKYQAAAANPGSLGLPSYAQGHLEGYLFPATYDVQPDMTAADVLRAMVQQFNQQASQLGVTAGARRVNLTPAQVITVASLVQAEGGRASDFPKIARVIDNRLAAGMQLDLDSTVMYALRTYGIMASDQQVQNTNSPYNTYRHTGLPPGPICSPGSEAIRAVLHPAAGNWIYFVTVDPAHGITKFTSSAAEFQQFRAQLQQNLGK